jgi:hypothetical protein
MLVLFDQGLLFLSVPSSKNISSKQPRKEGGTRSRTVNYQKPPRPPDLMCSIAPGDEGAAEREKGCVDVRAAFSSCDDFKNGQKTPCLRTGLTRYSQPLPLAGFSNVRLSGNRKSSENHCIK